MTKSRLAVIYAPFSYIVQVEESKWDETALYKDMVQFYLPLLKYTEASDIPRCIIAISPLLLEMWNERDFQHRFRLYLQEENDQESLNLFIRWNSNLVEALKDLSKQEKIECIPTTASHCLLPYAATREGKALQISYGIDMFEASFGMKPSGFWLEEGFVTEEEEEILHEKGIQYTFINRQFIGNDEIETCTFVSSRNIILIPFEANEFKKVSREMTDLPVVYVESMGGRTIPDRLFSSLKTLKSVPINFQLSKPFFLETLPGSATIHTSTIAKRFGDRWLNSANQEVYTISYEMEQALKQCARFFEHPLFALMLKKWLLISNREWARRLAEERECHEYVHERLNRHVKQFYELYELVRKEEVGNETTTSFLFRNLSTHHLKMMQGVFRNEPLRPSTRKDGQLRILMLSWEFPPLVVGGLARHVFDLSRTLAKQGHDVYVLTTFVEGLPTYEKIHGVHVCRVLSLQPHHPDFLAWVNSLNAAMVQESLRLSQSISFNLVHAHDWLVGSAAQIIQRQLRVPLVCTIHATEHGRNNGIHNEMQEIVHKKEARLIEASQAVIVCSEYMKKELIDLFYVQSDKISVFPNGIDPDMFLATCRPNQVKKKYKLSVQDKLIFSVGRVVYEKGFQTLIESAEIVKRECPDVRFIIAGKGPLLHEYRMLVKEKKMEEYVQFVGYVTDDERNQLLHLSRIVVFPSLYEPFGIVALEGMVVGKPTIVTDTGGLKTIVEDGVSGIKVRPGDAVHLAEQLSFLLAHEEYACSLGQNGKKRAETMFGWEHIAIETTKLFQDEIFSFQEKGRD